MSCAFALAWSPRITNARIKYVEMRRMCYLPVCGPACKTCCCGTPEDFALPGLAKVPIRESYTFSGRLAIPIIYITSTTQRTYISTLSLKPNKPVCPRKVAGPQLQGQKQKKKSGTQI